MKFTALPVNDLTDTTLNFEQLQRPLGDLAVIKEAPLNVQWVEYGAKGNGTTDDTAAIQAAINAAAAVGGGTVFLPPTSAFYKITSALTGASHTILQGASAGGFTPIIQYSGVAAINLIKYTGASHFAIRDLSFKIGGNYANASKLIRLTDCVYWNVSDVSCFVAPGGTASGATGLLVETAATGLVPPRGFGRIANFLVTSGGVAGLAGSRGIEIKGIVNGSQSDITLEGWGDIEEMEYGLYLNSSAATGWVTDIKQGGSWLFLGNTTQIKLVGAQNCEFEKPHTTNSSGSEHWNIDATSFNNVIVAPSYNLPNALGTDNGQRTNIFQAQTSKLVHLQAGGVAPAFSVGAGAGSTPTVSGNGSDMAGTITVTPGGAGIGAGQFGFVQFGQAFDVAPRAVLVTPGSAVAAALQPFTLSSLIRTTDFMFSVVGTPSAGVAYPFTYAVIA